LIAARPAANVGNPPAASPAAPQNNSPQRTVAARPTSRVSSSEAPREHVVADGDMLYGLAERYYGDGERFGDLSEANRTVLKRPDRLEVGTVLVIPNLSKQPAAEAASEAP